MVEYLTASTRLRKGWICLLGGLLWGGIAHGETLADPTRPPAALAAESQVGTTAAPSGPVLQSVLISPMRVVAIINGETVKVGDKVGDAHVVKIADGEVVLRNGKEIQTLKLYPDIEKLPAMKQAADTQKPSGNKGK